MLLARLIVWAAPAHGKSNIMVYVAICSLLGSFTVPSSKGIGLVAKEVFVDGPSNSRALALLMGLVGVLAVSILIQFYFINKALERFSSNNFEARYYVAFTSSVILASAVLFREWTALTLPDIFAMLSGLITVFVGVVLLRISEEATITWNKKKTEWLRRPHMYLNLCHTELHRVYTWFVLYNKCEWPKPQCIFSYFHLEETYDAHFQVHDFIFGYY